MIMNVSTPGLEKTPLFGNRASYDHFEKHLKAQIFASDKIHQMALKFPIENHKNNSSINFIISPKSAIYLIPRELEKRLQNRTER